MVEVIFKGKIMTLIQNEHVLKILLNSLINQLLGTSKMFKSIQMRIGLKDICIFYQTKFIYIVSPAPSRR